MAKYELDNKMIYDNTYKLENTVVHIIAPELNTPEEIEKILEEYHRAGYEIWKDYLKKKNKELKK